MGDSMSALSPPVLDKGTMPSARLTRVALLLLAIAVGLANLPCDGAKRRFTVADDIGLTHFGDPYTGQVDPIAFSPDGSYFAVDTERGRLDVNRPESTVRVYRTEDVHRYLLDPGLIHEPTPVFVVSKSTYKDGPIISHIHWLSHSRGIAFLAKTNHGNNQLFLVDLGAKAVHALTPETDHVTGFDIRDGNNFVYSVPSPAIRETATKESQATTVVGTGRSLDSLIFPERLYPFELRRHGLGELWAVVNGKRFRVEDRSSKPIHLYPEGQRALALSPDGQFVVTAVPVATVPTEWVSLYQAPVPFSQNHIRAGRQDLEAFDDGGYTSEYMLIDLSNGKIKRLTAAPIGSGAGWFGASSADWSPDGKSVALSNTFLVPNPEVPQGQSNRPCIAVVEIATGHGVCLESVKGRSRNGSFEDGFRFTLGLHFVSNDGDRLIAQQLLPDGSRAMTSYTRADDGSWRVESRDKESGSDTHLIQVAIEEDLNVPPVLVAVENNTKVSRVILDPNPQLKDIDLGEASVFRWKDKAGRDWVGGLYRPPDYSPGKRYPLVIQTHGFLDHAFRADGIYPTAFAARELAAEGILVLQVRDCLIRVTLEEGPCQVEGYEAAIEQLVANGLVDPDRVGIIGFSRTCYYVLEALATSALHFRAASITDGVNEGYLQYLTNVDLANNGLAHEADTMIGAGPFGEGLQLWLKRSPEFNMNKVTTPLLVVALGRDDVPFMWEPYAALRYLHKPVDFILLVEDTTHLLTNPAQRMASQGGSVDWFRFWLKDEEDRNLAKAQQYTRWRELRKLQEQNEAEAKQTNSASPR